ncbi:MULTISPECIES: N-acetylmuramidase family protein [unclassified Serratia (in: enterobacteria)]|uniref:N-acetylmuramidase family protein n=1 Tax=unclassified Serratia (in: enterobacteria) TaxID=2647522 RepID=UPI000500DF50|nr:MULTISPECIES: N-acetylmuramidase family protein [unclassified Serratia (in: enterobacteria)]KFK92204.1 peptidoglycan-binding protein [Serratia sp. Ag2]KFK97123.1 peptidoglycan-binding protein [Serratia sp. Ag1]
MSNLTSQDYQRAAALLGVPGAAVQAVAEVESAGAGMLPDGRPKILFERHVFRRLLLEKGIKVDGLPVDLVNSAAGGYSGGAAEHERLARAAKIERECALQSCSWGAFQIMGYHWKLLKYRTLQAFINAMYRGDAAQLEAFVRFINANSVLVKALRMLDWAAFAKSYNGPGYASNNYDKKMAAAFSRAGGQ